MLACVGSTVVIRGRQASPVQLDRPEMAEPHQSFTTPPKTTHQTSGPRHLLPLQRGWRCGHRRPPLRGQNPCPHLQSSIITTISTISSPRATHPLVPPEVLGGHRRLYRLCGRHIPRVRAAVPRARVGRGGPKGGRVGAGVGHRVRQRDGRDASSARGVGQFGGVCCSVGRGLVGLPPAGVGALIDLDWGKYVIVMVR